MNCRYVVLVCEPNALASGFSAATATGSPRLSAVGSVYASALLAVGEGWQ